MDRQVVYSALKTPDGTLLESFHRHDYKSYLDKNGKEYVLDGGLSEFVWSRSHDDGKRIIVYFDDPFELVRKSFHWGVNKDKKGSWLGFTDWTKLCDIEDEHLDVLCSYEPASSWARILFIREKQFRQLANELF